MYAGTKAFTRAHAHARTHAHTHTHTYSHGIWLDSILKIHILVLEEKWKVFWVSNKRHVLSSDVNGEYVT